MTMNTEAALDWIARLIAFDTTSVRSNRPLIVEVAEFLEKCGARVRVIADDSGAKANLFATLGPDAPGGIALSGHTDVVPVAGQDWRSDPFAAIQDGGRLYGRGACDMKGFIGAALSLAPEFAGREMNTPLHLALSYDEEVGCVGVRSMIDAIDTELPRPALVIVGEPTEMRVVNAHKGISQQTTVVTGRDAHSSRPGLGANAIAYAAEIVAFLGRMADELGAPEKCDFRFDPPGTTFNVGAIEGGTAVNIIARECRFRWEFRPVPGIDPESVLRRVDAFVAAEILPRMRRTAPDASVVTTCEVTAPPLDAANDSPAVTLAFQMTGENSATTASFVCEAGLFAGAGIPAVVCGPGSVAQAHQPDEFVEIAQIETCLAFLRRVMERAAAG